MMVERQQSEPSWRTRDNAAASSPLRDALEGREPARTVYIVRHGATKLNNQTDLSVDRERGWSNVPLTAEGRREAQSAALKLRSKHIEVIVSSDLERAKQTAQIIGRVLGIKPTFCGNLRPWNLGDLTGKRMDEAKPQIEAYAKKPDEPGAGGPGGLPGMTPPPSPRKKFDEAIANQRNNASPAGMAHMAHGRAIAGAKALHAVGHITAAQRDQHIARSRSALRKPFGSFAP